MKFFRKLFAEKLLRYYEGINAFIRVLGSIPIIKKHIKEDTFSERNKTRKALGIAVQVFVMLGEFLRKFFYVFTMIYLPYFVIGKICPLIQSHQELTMIYMFIMLSTICGSIANNTLYTMGDRDYLMIRVMLVSPYMNFLGKLIYKMVTEFLFYFISLIIFGVSPLNSLYLCLLTFCVRPIGEMFAIISFDHLRWLYENRSVFNGTVMAVCVLIAYGLPLFNRRVSVEWLNAIHPFVIIVMLIAGIGSMYFLWWYKHYRVIIRKAMHMKREG